MDIDSDKLIGTTLSLVILGYVIMAKVSEDTFRKVATVRDPRTQTFGCGLPHDATAVPPYSGSPPGIRGSCASAGPTTQMDSATLAEYAVPSSRAWRGSR
jgi:hypothetical protein